MVVKSGKLYAEHETPKYVDDLLLHIMKLLNIFHSLLTNSKPIFYPKDQKNDFFIGPKEFQMYNHLGYFGNDYFYLKLYNLIKVSYDNYKVSTKKKTIFLTNIEL